MHVFVFKAKFAISLIGVKESCVTVSVSNLENSINGTLKF